MNEITKAILKAFGISDALLTKIEAASILEGDEAKNFKPDEIVTEFQAQQTALAEANPKLADKYTLAERGKILEQLDRYLKQQFGLTVDELKEKTVSEKITLAKTKLESGYKGNSADLQNENIKQANRIKELEEIELPKVRKEIDAEKISFKRDNWLFAMLTTKEKDKELKLRAAPNGLFPGLKLVLENKYKIEPDEEGNFNILDKKTGLAVRNAAGTAILSPHEIMKEEVRAFGALEESNADGDGTEKKVIVIPPVEPVKPFNTGNNMTAAEKNLEHLKTIVKKK